MMKKLQDNISTLNLPFALFRAVPEAAPPNLVLDARLSTSIKCQWGSFSNLSLWNGVGIGYEVQYRLKGAQTRNWTSVKINGTSNRQHIATGLLKYRLYEFKVAGRTIKGSGVFSEVKEERTMEDGMQLKSYQFHELLFSIPAIGSGVFWPTVHHLLICNSPIL